MVGRKLLTNDGVIKPEQAADTDFELKSALYS
jgi:hypothetical protein